jgi:hypothetical protein
MRILITGCNKAQCTYDFYLQQQLQVAMCQYSLPRVLRDMGHDVDMRPVVVGESLQEYDEVFVFLHNPSGFAGYVYNALWAISQKPNCIFAFDDWQTDSIFSGITALDDPSKLFRSFVVDSHKHIPENIQSYQGEFISAIERIKSKTNRMLVPAFSGGDLTLLLDWPKELFFAYNPNPYHLNRQPATSLFPEPKQRVFNFAGLVQDKTKKWLAKQGVESTDWPLKQYGSRKDGQDRVVESEMMNVYASQWGILMPGYFHAGSGWWRARPLQIADVESILIGEPKEMMLYYRDESLANIRASDIATLSDSKLTEIAIAQREAIYRNHPLNKEVTRQELNAVLNA